MAPFDTSKNAELLVRIGRLGEPCFFDPSDGAALLLRQAGLIEMQPSGRGFTNVSLTPAGVRLLEETGQKPYAHETKDGCDSDLANFVLGTREFVEVTGIARAGEDVRKVEFRWKWKLSSLGVLFAGSGSPYRKLPLAKQFSLQSQVFAGGRDATGWGEFSPSTLWLNDNGYPGTAILRLYDDGWRIP